MRGFSLLPAGWCAGAPAELRKSGTLHKKSPRNLCNLPPIIFPKTLDTPSKICYTMYVIKRKRGNNVRVDKEKTSIMLALMGVSVAQQCPTPECDMNCSKCPVGRQTTFCGAVIKDLEREV